MTITTRTINGCGMCSFSEQFETPPSKTISRPVSPSKTSLTYQAIEGTTISNELIDSCAKLFSANYSVWGVKASTISQYTKTGL
jgi:hypothetical protein